MGVSVPHTHANLPKLIKNFRPEAQDLITKMLAAVPGKRLSIYEVMEHPYFKVSTKKTDTPSSSASDTIKVSPNSNIFRTSEQLTPRQNDLLNSYSNKYVG